MDLSLQKILFLLISYGVAGCFFLYGGRFLITKLDKFFGGILLICYTSFLVSMIGYASTTLIDVAREDVISNHLRDQVYGVIPVIAFLSSLFTFLFGGVGTSLVYASLSSNDTSDVVSSLKRLETRIEGIEQKIIDNKRTNYLRIFVNYLLLIGVVTLIYSQL